MNTREAHGVGEKAALGARRTRPRTRVSSEGGGGARGGGGGGGGESNKTMVVA